jgi:DNA repair ATPase RecN
MVLFFIEKLIYFTIQILSGIKIIMNYQQQLENKEQKKMQKKLREIENLKKKPNLTPEELAKVNKEHQYKKSMNKNKQLLETIPDDLQQVILSYLPINTRLNLLRNKYSIEYLTEKLVKLPKNLKTFDKLYHYVTMVEPILSEMHKINMTDLFYYDIFYHCNTNFEYEIRMTRIRMIRHKNYYYSKRIDTQQSIIQNKNYYID